MAVRNIERELQALAELRTSETPDAFAGRLRKALGDKVNLIVAKAATLAAEMQFRKLIPELCAAFDRLLIDPLKTDPKCWGKEGIAKALKNLGHTESTTFLKGIEHVQFEPVWGGEEDTAARLRGICALALLDCNDLTREDKLWSVMRLLTETSSSLQKDAAVALESLGGREAALLLRIKARMGDRDTTVTGQVFESLLRVEGERAVPFLVEFWRTPNAEVREEAALALGASRLEAGIAALENAITQKHPPLDHEVLFRALSISRHEEALRFLLEIVRTRRPSEALPALEALMLFRDSREIVEKISSVLASRSESEIHEGFRRLFQANGGSSPLK
jgi:hypothetical protein